jgi:hypothetical protein
VNQNIIDSAKIYGKGSDRVLTSYEIAVNEEAGRLALDDLALLNKRDILYEKAKESVRCSSTFSFKKGKSRSALQANKQNVPEKRKYTSESSREEHIAKLFETKTSKV